jgi:HK97 family phage portal protein
VFGNAYWLKIGDRGGRVRELWPLPATDVKVETDKSTVTYEYISRYVYTIGGQEFPYQPREVVHFRHGFGDAKTRTAWGPVNAAKREVAALNEGANYRGALLRNMGVPSHILSPTEKMWDRPDFEMTEDLSKRLKELWAALTKGDNRGGVLIPTFAAALERAGFSPQELDIAEMMKWDVDIVCALIGVPAMLIDLPSGEDHRSYANKREAREFFTEQTLVPLLDGIADDLTLGFPEFLAENERYAFNYDDVRALQEDQNAKYERVVKVREQSILTVDECRAELGFEAMTPKQKDELQPPEPVEPESSGDRTAANGSRPQPAARMNGNGKAVKAVATVSDGGTVYRYSAEAPGEVAKEEFADVDDFFRARAQRWAGEIEGEEEIGQ